jgi:hypothetical protein
LVPFKKNSLENTEMNSPILSTNSPLLNKLSLSNFKRIENENM